jgi:hypothetical protein
MDGPVVSLAAFAPTGFDETLIERQIVSHTISPPDFAFEL